MRLALLQEGFAFAIVGALGFIAHAAVLALLVHGLGMHPYPAWLPAFAVAVTVTYILNRHWTFRQRKKRDRRREYTRYVVLQSLGAVLNNVSYGTALWIHPLFRDEPIIALAVGSFAGMVANYMTAKYLAFSDR